MQACSPVGGQAACGQVGGEIGADRIRLADTPLAAAAREAALMWKGRSYHEAALRNRGRQGRQLRGGMPAQEAVDLPEGQLAANEPFAELEVPGRGLDLARLAACSVDRRCRLCLPACRTAPDHGERTARLSKGRGAIERSCEVVRQNAKI